MYLHHFGLLGKPFELTDDPAFYYPVPHEIASMTLLYAIEQQQGLAMLTGEPGTGKTTLLRRLLHRFDPHVHGVLLSDCATAGGSLLAQFARALGIKALADEMPIALRSFLERERSLGKSIVLMIDEAQTLTHKHFAEVRFLSNLESFGRRIVQVFLVGQPLLERKVARPELEAISQRIVVRTSIAPLSLEQTMGYIAFRLAAAGSHRKLFTAEAAHQAHERAGGVPRLINVICERALVVAYADDQQTIDAATVQAAIEDLSFSRETSHSSSPETEDVETRSRARMDRLEEKIDCILAALARGGFLRPDLVPSESLRLWLEQVIAHPDGNEGERREPRLLRIRSTS